MAAHFEVFDKLREFGKTLDNSTRNLPKFTEEEEETKNKARATLKLRAMVAEAKALNVSVEQSINDSKKEMSFDRFLTLCETRTQKMKESIENLEDHLVKYGYTKIAEKLPEVSPEDVDDFTEIAESSGESSTESPEQNSDKENLHPALEPEEPVFKFRKPEPPILEIVPPVTAESQVIDLLMTPVQPKTMTKLMQDPVHPPTTTQNTPTRNYGDIDTCPPMTTTPLISYSKKCIENTGFNTPDSSTELPVQPQTRTPMIKHYNQNPVTPDQVQQEMAPLVDDFPTPPVFETPGFQRYGSKRNTGAVQTVHMIETPSPPSLTSVHMLHAEDIPATKSRVPPVFELSPSPTNLNSTPILPNINEGEFQQLPMCLQNQFSLEHVNQLIEKTNTFLNTKNIDDRGFVSDDELLPVLKLGSMTRAFILLMIKLNYFTIVRNGFYEVSH